MRKKRLYPKSLLALPLAASFWLITPASGQSVGAPDAVSQQDHETMPPQAMPPQDQDRTKDDISRRELAEFDRFLDSHPEVAEQLHKDPSLVDSREFVQNHPALQSYLQEHPHVSEAVRDNPNVFMHREDRYERHEDGKAYSDNDRRGDKDITRKQLAEFDRFTDSHPEIAEQLRKNPSLVDNREFVQNHPALQAYLHEHPTVSQDIRDNPTAFMRREERYERYEDNYGRDSGRDSRDRPVNGETARFGEFLGGHSTIAEQLSKDPTLLKNQEYMANHPDLQDYLKAHPAAQAELKNDPDSFIRSAQQFSAGNNNVRAKNPALDPKPKQ
jgi:hypothetical protein